MAHPQEGNNPGHGIPYDPVPNPQQDLEPSFDIHDTPYDPYSSEAMSIPHSDDLNPDEPSITLIPPRFFGTIDGEGIRQSLASLGSRPESENLSSLYALNPESLSARATPPPGAAAADTFSAPYRDEPRSPSEDVDHGPSALSSFSRPRFLKEKEAVYATPTSKARRRNVIILAALGGLILLIVVVVVPVYFLVVKPHSNASSSSAQPSHSTSASPSSTSTPSSPKSAIVTGGDGSTVTMENGTTFTYSNPFGGYWYFDPNDPFNTGARAQSWTPALNETFRYGIDPIRG